MVMLLQRPTKPGHERRTVLYVFLWLISGLIPESISTSAINGNPLTIEKMSNYTNKIFQNTPSNDTDSKASVTPAFNRPERAVPHIKNSNKMLHEIPFENDEDLGYILKAPVDSYYKAKTDFRQSLFPRPGPSMYAVEQKKTTEEITNSQESDNSDKKRNTVIPAVRFGQSGEDDFLFNIEKSDASHSMPERSETLIPMVQYGRGNLKRGGASNSVIPYPRFGRSLYADDNEDSSEFDILGTESEEVGENVQISDFDLRNEMHNTADSNQIQKRGSQEEYVIPYPRPGRRNEENANKYFDSNTKRSDSEYMVPQIRYGRSMNLLSIAKTDELPKEKPQTFVLPYPRPGRSNKYHENSESLKYSHVMLPYPRPGRSNMEEKIDKEFSLSLINKRQDYVLPNARLGRSPLNEDFDDSNMMNSEERFLGLKVNPLFLKKVSENPKETDDISVFVIPYPRPGKKSLSILRGPVKNPKLNDVKNKETYVLPYPRPGKRISSDASSKKIKNVNNEKENVPSHNYVLPYPRPGRSDASQSEIENDTENNDATLNTEQTGENFVEPDVVIESMAEEDDDDIEIEPIGSNNYVWSATKRSKNSFMIPYGRVGRSYGDILHYSGTEDAGKDGSIYLSSNNDASDSKLQELDYDLLLSRSETLGDYNSSQLRLRRSNNVIPYPRFGRSDSVLPYPRPGRSDFVVPYPRLGRSNSVVPYPRLGRSNSVVPYPRLGRSDFVVPYPRLGRSDTVVPYPRPGRSNSVIPYPRLGRSDFVVPYPRLGRSDSVVPYPRPGRSNSVIPYPRLGRSDSVVPYPRLGRSDYVVPYPRLGRSNYVVPFPRLGRFDSVVPYPRLGRSKAVVPYPRLGRSKSTKPYRRLGKSNSIVPYPRFGRSDSLVPYLRLYRSETPSPYAKSGKSREEIKHKEYLLVPNLRPGRSKSERNDIYIVPYPRPGRAEIVESVFQYPQMNRRTEKKDPEKGMIIPYPRPGRSNVYQGYVLPHPRIGRSEENTRNESDTFPSDTVIPYPRLGRSQEQNTPPERPSPVHKLNKHMLNNVDDSIYILPYPRPGRNSQ